MDLVTELRRYIVEEFFPGKSTDVLRPTDDLTLVLDSVHILLLARHLEEAYRIEVADEEISLENFESIERLAGFVRSKRA